MLSETSIRRAVLAQAHGLVVLDPLAPANPAQPCPGLRAAGLAGTSSVMCWPTASAAVYPNSRSAAGFQPVMVPSSDVVMMASLEDSTAALNSRSRSA